MKHRNPEQNREDADEDEDEEYGVRKTVKEPSKEERETSTKRPFFAVPQLVPTLRERAREAKIRLAETPRGSRRWRRCIWTSCSWEMKARTGRWWCWW